MVGVVVIILRSVSMVIWFEKIVVLLICGVGTVMILVWCPVLLFQIILL